jgi:hypothetical protein
LHGVLVLDILKGFLQLVVLGTSLFAYHVLVIQPKLDMSVAERGYYVLDVEAIMTVKAAQLALEYRDGKLDISDPVAFDAAIDGFKLELDGILRSVVGNAPVFQPKAVYSAADFVDLTPYVAEKLNIDLSKNFMNDILNTKPAPAPVPE